MRFLFVYHKSNYLNKMKTFMLIGENATYTSESLKEWEAEQFIGTFVMEILLIRCWKHMT